MERPMTTLFSRCLRDGAAGGLILLAAACAPASTGTPPAWTGAYDVETVEDAARAIDAEALRAVIEEISSDAYEGRSPGSAGDSMTRRFLAERLAALGFEPGASEDKWEQPVELVGMTAEMPDVWEFERGAEKRRFLWRDEYMAASGTQQPAAAIRDAEVVFVGYGIVAPEENWDDYKGVDVSGKVLLMLNDDPDWSPLLFEGERRLYYGRWTYKYESAAERGAAGAIIVHTDQSAGYPWQVVQTSWSGEQFELPAAGEPRIEVSAWLTEEAASELVALAGLELGELVESARHRDFRPVPLGIRTSLEFETDLRRTVSANVLGLLRGRDATLSDEFVVYTAHHDHLGQGEPDETGDSIYNGALDNASGTAQVLAVAEAFASLPVPARRSILVAFVAAEEQGLLGSLHLARNPPSEPGLLAANINVDGGNIWGRTTDVAVVGRGKSSLEDLLEAAAARQDRTLVNEPFPDKGYYYRSDQLNFARIGVPALYFKSGTAFRDRPEGWGVEQTERWLRTNYHQPSDEFEESWDLSGMVEDARLAFEVGLAAAESGDPPAWRPGDEFEAARLEALAALGVLGDRAFAPGEATSGAAQ
jgi:hypothetical protein